MSLFYSMVVFSTAWPLLIGGDFEVLLYTISTNINMSTKEDLTTETPLLARCC